MNLYLLTYDEAGDDDWSHAVVAAVNADEARRTHPCWGTLTVWDDEAGWVNAATRTPAATLARRWTDPDGVRVELLGVANPGTVRSVILDCPGCSTSAPAPPLRTEHWSVAVAIQLGRLADMLGYPRDLYRDWSVETAAENLAGHHRKERALELQFDAYEDLAQCAAERNLQAAASYIGRAAGDHAP
jgi:hypothetical protein